MMDIERYDGTKEHKEFEDKEEMLLEARFYAYDPNTKKIVLHFPKLIVPKKRRKK